MRETERERERERERELFLSGFGRQSRFDANTRRLARQTKLGAVGLEFDLSPRGGGEVRTYGGGNTCHR
jgi:hypothetical protein